MKALSLHFAERALGSSSAMTLSVTTGESLSVWTLRN